MKLDELLAIAVVAGALFWPQLREHLPLPGSGPAPQPGPAVVVPNPADQGIVDPVKQAVSASPQRAKFANYFAVWSKVIEQNPERFSTVSAMNAHNATAAKVFIDAEPGGGNDTLGPAIVVAIHRLLGGDASGVQDRTITKDEALRVTRALEWACR